MIKLMKLEIRKHKLVKTLRGVGIANLVIIGFLTMVLLVERSEGRDAFLTFESAFSIIDTFVRATFMIFAAVWISKLIIDEYKTKTISLLFLYPINRKKLMISKLLIVFIYTFLCIMLSNLLISTLLIIFDSFLHLIPDPLTSRMYAKNMVNVLISALSTAGMSLIPLYFGMLKKSVPATIVAALLLNTIVTSNWGEGTSLYSIVLIPISLGIIGIFISYFTIRRVDVRDI